MITLFQQWTIKYFNNKTHDQIKQWPIKLKAKFVKTIVLIKKHGPNLGLPTTKPLGGGLFEIRIKAQEGIGRAFFCYVKNNKIIILHGFIKKTQETPKNDIELARKRLNMVLKEEKQNAV